MSLNQTIRNTLPLLLLLGLPAYLDAQATNQITFSGQVRPRLESRTPVDGSWNGFTSMRVRAALEARLEGNVRVFVQFQDVRLFGEESSTLSDYRADNFDLHQGFVELTDVPSLGGALRVGRQELALGEQRLVGAVNWAQQGRSFDGFRYTAPSMGGMKVDLFAMKLREETSATQDWESSLAGAYGTLPTGEAGSLDVYGLLTTDSREDHSGEITFGGLWKGGAGPFDLRLEGSLQTGQRNGIDVSAYMVGARAGSQIHESVTATLWYDYLSGDDDPGDDEIGVFNTLFATNHGFYGFADYFTGHSGPYRGTGAAGRCREVRLRPLPNDGSQGGPPQFPVRGGRGSLHPVPGQRVGPDPYPPALQRPDGHERISPSSRRRTGSRSWGVSRRTPSGST